MRCWRSGCSSPISDWWSWTSSTGSASSSATYCARRRRMAPRTCAWTVSGDLAVSTLSELPAGRSSIATHVVPAADKPRYLERAWERVREEVARGQQAYVVCPRIGDGDDSDADPGEDDYARVAREGSIPRGIGETGRRQPLAVLDVAATL